MAKIFSSLTELIGNTPLMYLNNIAANHGVQANLIAKIEFFNPGGSVKDRVALSMIEDAEKKGKLNHRTYKWQHRGRFGLDCFS